MKQRVTQSQESTVFAEKNMDTNHKTSNTTPKKHPKHQQHPKTSKNTNNNTHTHKKNKQTHQTKQRPSPTFLPFLLPKKTPPTCRGLLRDAPSEERLLHLVVAQRLTGRLAETSQGRPGRSRVKIGGGGELGNFW